MSDKEGTGDDVVKGDSPQDTVPETPLGRLERRAADVDQPSLDATWPATPRSKRKLDGLRGQAARGNEEAAARGDAATTGDRQRGASEAEHVLDPREEVVAMSPLNKRMAERLMRAQHATVSLTCFDEFDMNAVLALCDSHGAAFRSAHGVELGLMPFFVKAVVGALEAFPILNAEAREDEIVYKRHYDLGIAVTTDRGPVVPVLRNADRDSFGEIAVGIDDLTRRARERKLVLGDLIGATFTISDHGGYGSMMSTPLLNHPQTGILGLHSVVRRPIAVGDAIEIRPVMYAALGYDHRVVAGRDAAQFLVALKECIERADRQMLDL